jgi:D-alanine-D-alanine ligase
MAANRKQIRKIGVLYGGNSAERAISLRSGRAVLDSLLAAGKNAVGIDVRFDETLFSQLAGIDVAFIALHGRGGEDGIIQAVLSILGIPFTGSSVMASALGMDKLRCKQLWIGCGLPTPAFQIVRDEAELEGAFAQFNGPIMMKPPHEGSSIGMTKVTRSEQLYPAYEEARTHDEVIMLEQWIEGEEYTCAILQGRPLPAIRLIAANDFYDFHAKYQSTETRYLCPCGLTGSDEAQLQKIALAAFESVGCTGWGRVDLMRDQQGQFQLLEVNTVPGLTDHSLVPMAAKAAGMRFSDLIEAILDTAVELSI